MSNKKKERSLASFQEDWLSKLEFKSWLRKVEKQSHKAYCVFCSKTIDIGNGGSSALLSHQKGKGHTELVRAKTENRIGNFFKNASGSHTDEAHVVSTCEKPPFVMSDDVLNAEIVWCLYLIQCHHSYRSCDPISGIFKRMFGLSCQLVQQFQLKKDKARYLIVYGIYPALLKSLRNKINASPWYSVSFDESLNRHQQLCQMDVNIRYWSTEHNQAKTTYYDSRYLWYFFIHV